MAQNYFAESILNYWVSEKGGRERKTGVVRQYSNNKSHFSTPGRYKIGKLSAAECLLRKIAYKLKHF